MAQLTGSGPGHGVNYVMVDSSVGVDEGRLFVNSSGVSTAIYSGDIGPAILDKASHNISTINREHRAIHDGDHFNIRSFDTLATDGNKTFGFTTPNSTKWIHFIFEIEGTTQTELRTWEGATLSGGNVGIPGNNNRNASTVSDVICVSNPVISGTSATSGLLIESHSKGLAGTTPSKATAVGESEREDEWVFKSGTTYLFEIKNLDSNNTNVVDYAFRWYESTDKTQQF